MLANRILITPTSTYLRKIHYPYPVICLIDFGHSVAHSVVCLTETIDHNNTRIHDILCAAQQ